MINSAASTVNGRTHSLGLMTSLTFFLSAFHHADSFRSALKTLTDILDTLA